MSRLSRQSARRSRRLTAVAATSVFALVSGLPAIAGAQPSTPLSPNRDAVQFDQPGGFYDTRDLAPASPGAVLRAEPADLPLAVSVPGLPPLPSPLPAVAQRVVYQTLDVDGRPVATSGALYDSTAPWTGPGPRPTVVLGPGTQGQGDACAPSRTIETGVGTNPRSGGPVVSYEEGFALVLAAQGFRVMVVDYIGLGTPGIHTYSDRTEQAHAMLDGARAARDLTGSGSPLVFWGHSQGGGASAAAAELAPEYAPELDVRAAYASAPPADLLAVLDHIDGSSLTGAIGFAINGMVERYPAVQQVVDRHVNDAGRRALDDLAGLCLADTRGAYGGRTTTEWTNSGQGLGELIREEPDALRVLDHQRIGNRAPVVPVMLAGGINDDIIPLGQVEQLGRDWCRQGTSVHFRYETTPLIPGVTHAAAAVTNFGPALQFVNDRLAGLPSPDDCGTF
ncbi:alpha/beta fold hydrolase [Dietzia sp. SLG310A2-38A2]|uniref:alpha/beta fold hydrolase n=1 Tax=Dietzia sp. SLG310A2-38A2 TaxID=1630643 RepID=UPI0015FA98C0|nr:alpha/beta fold hydrolase [Dietzia sp. SLG310A2-38A2]MBB1029813.1 alpha/beta fold hydrolase [Dietzia sp. SLG310A2-38A2]